MSSYFRVLQGDVTQAYSNRDAKKCEAHEVYQKHRTLSKVAFKDNKAACTTLRLTGAVPQSYSGWLGHSRGFYNNLLAKEEWVNKMSEFGTGADKLSEALQLVEAVDALHQVISSEKGDAQSLTQQRDRKIDELAEWINDYEAIARIALIDNPQQLEKLGIVVKN